MRAGVMLNILCIGVLIIAINTWGYDYFNLGTMPGWTQQANLNWQSSGLEYRVVQGHPVDGCSVEIFRIYKMLCSSTLELITFTFMYTHTPEEEKLVKMFLTLLEFTNRFTVSILRMFWWELVHHMTNNFILKWGLTSSIGSSLCHHARN